MHVCVTCRRCRGLPPPPSRCAGSEARMSYLRQTPVTPPRYCRKHLLGVRPDRCRTDSSNFDPMPCVSGGLHVRSGFAFANTTFVLVSRAWLSGVQIVSLNMQASLTSLPQRLVLHALNHPSADVRPRSLGRFRQVSRQRKLRVME